MRYNRRYPVIQTGGGTSAAGAVEYTDSATIYNELTASGSELAERVEAATIPLDLAASGTDIRERTDAATVYVDLTPSGLDVHGKEYADSATAYFDVQASGTDLAEYIEAATVLVDLQASGTDLLTREYTDADTVYLELVASSTDIAVYIETANYLKNPDLEVDGSWWARNDVTIVVSRTTSEYHNGIASLQCVSSGVDVYEYAYSWVSELTPMSAGTPIIVSAWIKGASGQVGVSAVSLTDGVYDTFIDPGTVKTLNGTWQYFEYTYTGVLATSDRLDICIGMMDNAGGAQALTFYVDDAKLLIPSIIPEGVYLNLQASGTEYVERVSEDADTVYLTLTASGTDVGVFIEGVVFPTTGMLDNFNRANADPLDGNWSEPVAAGNAVPMIEGNQVVTGNTPPNGPSAWWNAQQFGPDCEAWIQCSADFETGEEFEVYARMTGDLGGTNGFNGYVVTLQADGNLHIGRRDLGVYYGPIETAAVTATTGDYIGIRCVGSTIEAWHRPVGTGVWTKVSQTEDSTYSTAGYIAFAFWTEDATTAVDNFGGGVYVAPYVYLDLQPSSAELVEDVDSATVPLTLTPDSAELVEVVDSAEVFLNLRVPITVSFFPTTGILDTFTGADENPIATNWSGPIYAGEGQLQRLSGQLRGSQGGWCNSYYDVAQFRDTEVYVTLPNGLGASEYCILYTRLTTPGAPDGYQLVLADAGVLQLQYRVSGNAYTIWSMTNTFAAGDKYGLRVVDDLLEAWKYTTASGTWTLVASTVNRMYSDPGYVGIEVLGTTPVMDDFGGGTFDRAKVGIDILEAVDAATVYLDLEASGTDVIEREITDSATVYADIQASGTDIAEYIEAQTIPLDIEASGTEFTERVTEDAATAYLDLTTSGTDIAEYVEAATPYVDLQASGTDLAEYIEAATVPLDLQASGTDVIEHVYTDAAESYIDLTPSSADIAEYIESVTVPFDLESSGVELAEYVDAFTIYVDLQSSGTELREIADEATTYLLLTPSGTEILVLAPQILRPNSDIDANNWQVPPLWEDTSDQSNATYIYATAT